MSIKSAFIGFVILSMSSIAFPQTDSIPDKDSLLAHPNLGIQRIVSARVPHEPDSRPSDRSYTIELWLTAIVLSFGIVVLIIELILLRSLQLSAQEILRILSVTIIIIGALLCITAGFSSEQIAPVIGLFGTIAGYILGHTSNNSKKEVE